MCVSNDDDESNRQVVKEAVYAGKRDAQKVINTAPNSMERNEILLEIHARETELRQKGFGHAADDYIYTVNKELEENGIK